MFIVQQRCIKYRTFTFIARFYVHDDDDDAAAVCFLCTAQLLRKSLPATIGEYKNHPL